MEVIAICNQKGGVSKTTSCVNIGSILAEEGKKVLLVDLDSQGNLTQSLGITEYSFSIYDCLCNGVEIKDAIVHTDFNIDIVSSNMNLGILK